ncbi:MAG TPA: GspH/FimT family pseudopilin [Syntrophobacteria bacterium]|nr:GspH/FimT family pseudopilin [Syntrophobacteria bacterium]
MTHRDRGATVTDVVVTMAVVATLFGVATHQFMQWLPHYRLTYATRALLIQARRAKLQAIQRGAVYYLDFNVNDANNVEAGPCVLWEDWNNNHQRDRLERSETLLDLQAIPGITLKPYPAALGGPTRGPHDTEIYAGGGDGVTFNLDRIKFNPNGTCSAGTIYLHNSRGRTCAIRLRSNGVIQLWRHEGGEWEQW